MTSPAVTVQTVPSRKLAAVRRARRDRLRRYGVAARRSTRSGRSCARTPACAPTDTTSSSITTRPAETRRWTSTSASRSSAASSAKATCASRNARGEVATAVHVGPYDQLRGTHDAIHAWRAATAAASPACRGRSTETGPTIRRSSRRPSATCSTRPCRADDGASVAAGGVEPVVERLPRQEAIEVLGEQRRGPLVIQRRHPGRRAA